MQGSLLPTLSVGLLTWGPEVGQPMGGPGLPSPPRSPQHPLAAESSPQAPPAIMKPL